MLPLQRSLYISSMMNGWQLDRNQLRHAFHERLRSWSGQLRMRRILVMSCRTVTYPSARLMSTNKPWARKEAFIRHPINRDCETSVPPQGRAFALSARRRSCNGAGYLSRLRTAKGLPVAAPSFRDLYGRVGNTKPPRL